MHESMSARTFLQLQARAAGPDILVGSWVGKKTGFFLEKTQPDWVFQGFFFLFFGFIFFLISGCYWIFFGILDFN